MTFGFDIETACNVQGCTDSNCKHALFSHTSRITVIGIWHPTLQATFRNLDAFKLWYETVRPKFRTHSGKFDVRMARAHGLPITYDDIEDDSCLMAVASYEKIPERWLATYETARKELNKKRKKGHREAGMHSLKTTAPYFLGVNAFWETELHDNDEYVLLDCEYAYRLVDRLRPMLERQGTYSFYKDRLIPWQGMFCAAEERGVLIDLERARTEEERCLKETARLEAELNEVWKDAVPEYQKVAREKLSQKYTRSETIEKHLPLTINYASPLQLKWLLKDYLGLDIRDFNGKDSTDAEVLERLAAEGRDDVRLLLKYREVQKLATTYYPQYRELTDQNGILRASFNLDVTVTGRTSSSSPNLQNQPGDLHALFIARPGYKILTKDLEAIEPAILMFYSEDEKGVKLIQSGDKFHAANAQAVFEHPEWDIKRLKKEHPAEYDDAKNFGLSCLYGARWRRVLRSARQRGRNWTESRCKEIVKNLDAAWPDVVKFKEWIDKEAEVAPIRNFFGRMRRFGYDDIYMKNLNSLIQSTASDLLVQSAYDAVQEFKAKSIDAHFLMSVHDECVFEVPEDRAEECDEIVTRNMTKWNLWTRYGAVPLRVEGKLSHCWEK